MPTAQNASAGLAYSASVRLTLRIGPQRFELAQVAPTWIQLEEAVTLPSGRATLEIDIDGRCSPIDIEIEAGAAPARRFSYELPL